MSVEKIFFEGKEIILVGTAHISEESAKLVKETIEKEKPEIVGVELDIQRFSQLKKGPRWGQMNLGQVVSSGQTYLLLVNLMLANIQRQLGEKVGVKPGIEMLEAIKECEEKKIPIALLDRNVSITLKRAIKEMSFFEKIKFGYTIILGVFGFGSDEISKEKIEAIKQKDVMTQLMEQLSKEFPSIKKVLVDERDVFIANKIMMINSKKIVAVVGAGHLSGIKKNIGKRVNLKPLEETKKQKSVLKYIGLIVPILFFALFFYTFFVKGVGATLSFLVLWFLVNGTLSALGVLIARGHPFSIAAAFAAAPFTSLHPLIAAGWFAGFVEAKIRNPKVADFETLRNLNTFGDFTKNQVTKILLVVAFANLGSTIGTLIAFPVILALVG